MPELRGRLVLLCQQTLALAVVVAFAVSAAGVASLEIEGPAPGATAAPVSALVAEEVGEPTVTEVSLEDQAAGKRRTPTPTSDPESDTESVPESDPDSDIGTGAADRIAVTSEPLPVSGFATVGVTWDAEEPVEHDELAVEVRSRDGAGWSAWQEMPFEDEHAADAVETDAARSGTDAVIVGEVGEVQVRAATPDGTVPDGFSLALVDPGTTTQVLAEPELDTGDLDGESVQSPGEPSADAALMAGSVTAKPRIFSRAQWGANERLRDPGSLRYGEVHAGFVHHTVNANGYSRADVPAILRGIYAYHTQSRGWSDIGYNFLVDRFGRIWEGRHGGVARPVVGAHTLGYNDDSFAMSAIGNFETATPSARMIDAYGRLFAWKLSLHGVDAGSMRQQVGRGTFPAINGHRDAGSTACPGRHLYAKLGRIRSLAEGYQKSGRSRDIDANISGSKWPDLVVRDARTKKGYVVRTGGQVRFKGAKRAAGGLGGADLLVAAGDLNGDGRPDLLARNRRTGVTSLRPGNGSGGFGGAIRTTSRFERFDQLTGVGDWDGDGNRDLVGRHAPTKRLLLIPGRGNGSFAAGKVLSRGWGGYDVTIGVGDLDRDGRRDLAARKGRTLYLVRGTRRGIAAPAALPRGWGRFDHITGGGDVTNDGIPDVVTRERRSGLLYVFPGDGAGGLEFRLGGFRGYARADWLDVGGQVAGSRRLDLLGRGPAGNVNVYTNTGRVNIAKVVNVSLDLAGSDLVLGVGDWDGDGDGDIMTRDKDSGSMYFRAGNGGRRFAAPVRAATGWGSVTLLAHVGDVTGDGYPDLMGRYGGNFRIYPSNGRTGFRQSYVAHSRISSNRQAGAGLWNRDAAPDVFLRRADGTVWLWRGNGPGGLTTGRQVDTQTQRYNWFLGLGDVDGDGRSDVVARAKRTGALWLLPGTADGLGKRRMIATGYGRYDLAG